MFSILMDRRKKEFSPLAKTLTRPNYSQAVWILAAALSILRMVLGATIELGNDEAYYWLYTRELQWNYFDHPPLVAVWGKMFTFNAKLDDYELLVRMGSILSAAMSTWFIYQAVARLHSEKAGWYAAVLYNTSFYAGFVSGLLLMPDSPQMFFWTFSMWMLVRIEKDPGWLNWLAFGLAAGLCIMSKVHGVFLWLGLGAYIIFLRRQWLRLPQAYLALLLTVLVASPILIWNIQHDFVTYRFHSQRVSFGGTARYGNFLGELGGQLLFNNPVNVLITCTGIFGIRKLASPRPLLLAFLLTGLPLILILLALALFRPVFPHWSGPAYVSLIPVAAIWLAERSIPKKALKWARWSMAALAVFGIAWPVCIQLYPGTWGRQAGPDLGKGDVSLDRFGWKKAGEEFMAFYAAQGQTKVPLVCNSWWGAHVEYYFCQPAELTMIGLGPSARSTTMPG